jgi:hypothetical protein
VYGKYILVNLSWLVGSLGTLFLDMGVFAQFFLYRNNAAQELLQRTRYRGTPKAKAEEENRRGRGNDISFQNTVQRPYNTGR